MRKITCIILTLTFILYLGGVQVMYWIKMSVCKEQVQTLIHGHKLSRKNTVDFSFTSSEYNSLDWSEQNKEFTYKGERYDIVGIQYFSEEIIVKCYSDNEETEVIDAFSGFIKKMFSCPQHTNESNTDIASNIYKEYLPSEFFVPSHFARVLISIKATCVLVNVSAKVDDIWHPPTLV
jgi:hypothetical protein